jgi:hypothetical protein
LGGGFKALQQPIDRLAIRHRYSEALALSSISVGTPRAISSAIEPA